ncbi:MAG: hypothetical protein ACE5EV_00665, partial [Gaiellales bacterium]
MSGFAATFSRAPDPEIGTRADRMSARLLHRGAVETVAGQDEQVAVRVHNRERGVYRATASVDAESVVIFDGALLDEDALLAELGAAGVAEAAGEGLRRHGAAWLSRLDGSFAIVVLDRRTGTVSLIRDRFGHRPLAAAVLPDRVLVASEVKCFLPDSSLRRAVDEDGLASALSLGLVLGLVSTFASRPATPEGSWAPALSVHMLGVAAGAAMMLVGAGAVIWCRRRRRDTPQSFLRGNDDAEIVEAIRSFEKRTSGEIRVHLATGGKGAIL